MNLKSGQILKEARLRQNLSVAELHERTRIAIRIIEAIESGQTADLPIVHYRAFVRTLAETLEVELPPADESVEPPSPEESPLPQIDGLEVPGSAWIEPSRRIRIRWAWIIPLILGLTLAALYWFKGAAYFRNAVPDNGDLWVPDSLFTHILSDSSYEAMSGLFVREDAREAEKTVQPAAPVSQGLRGRIELSDLFKRHSVYARRRDLYLPNAVTLSRLEALDPELNITTYFTPEDSVAMLRLPPLLQIQRAAYLPKTVWQYRGTSRHRGAPLIEIRHQGELLIRWNKAVDKRIETILFEIADVAQRLDKKPAVDEDGQ